MTPARLLLLLGAAPFLLLGVAHAWHTPTRREQARGLSPRDPALPGAMAASALGLTSRTDVWRAWIGFNFSHSLGAILLALLAMVAGRSDAAFAFDGPLVVPLVTAAAGIYLVVALKYWFRTPVLGVAFGCACFVLSWVARLTG